MEKDGVFVHVNDSIRKLVSADPVNHTWEFICECPELSCHTLVSLTLTEFDEHRASSPPQPILAPEHANGRG